LIVANYGRGGGASLADIAIYYRRESSTQTPDDARRQVQSGELWGRGARPNGLPAVKAYLGGLPDNVRGLEFTTDIPPEPTNHPFQALWYATTLGTTTRYDNGSDFVVLSIKVLRNTQC
jgi:hypothetical protein